MSNKKHFLLSASLAAVLTACSSDELAEPARQDAISFRISADRTSRAAGISSNTNLPDAFKVWAVSVNGESVKPYLNGDVYRRSGMTYTGGQYWPAEGTLNLYAIANDQGNFSWPNGSNPSISQFTVNPDVRQQTDLLYSVKLNQSRPTDGSPISINFRHALAQIVFQACNVNSQIHVDIEGIRICNAYAKGSYAYPSESTDADIEGETTHGKWSMLENISQWSVEFPTVELSGNPLPTYTSLTSDDASLAMLLIPQSTQAWEPSTLSTPGDSQDSYLMVKCKIWNCLEDRRVNKNTDVVLWPRNGGDAAWVAIPCSFRWEEGKRYIYRLTFGKGNGGYNPDPEGPDPDPVLTPIEINLSVDEFVDVMADKEI